MAQKIEYRRTTRRIVEAKRTHENWTNKRARQIETAWVWPAACRWETESKNLNFEMFCSLCFFRFKHRFKRLFETTVYSMRTFCWLENSYYRFHFSCSIFARALWILTMKICGVYWLIIGKYQSRRLFYRLMEELKRWLRWLCGWKLPWKEASWASLHAQVRFMLFVPVFMCT